MNKAKNVMSATFNPWAECLGVDDDTPCPENWGCDQGPDTRSRAKWHAEMRPGHRLRVVVEKVDLYRADS
jgi:hypothetical protein